MKQLTVIFTILTALLLATSCSKEELPGDENTDEPGQMQTYTFTVSPDLTMEGDAETRSEGTPEEMPKRCFMQIFGNNVSQDVQQSESIENGSFTFSVKLPNTYLLCEIAQHDIYFLVLGRQRQWGHSDRPPGSSIHAGNSGFRRERNGYAGEYNQQRSQPETCSGKSYFTNYGSNICQRRRIHQGNNHVCHDLQRG